METINLQTVAVTQDEHILYSDQNLALGFNAQQLRDMGAPMLLDGFIAAFILDGNAQIYIDDQVYNLRAGNVIICRPRHILERTMTSFNIRIRSMLFSPSYFEELLRTANHAGLNIGVMLSQHRVATATPHELQQLSDYHDLILAKLQHPDTDTHAQSLLLLLTSMVTELYGIMHRSSDREPDEAGTSAELIMKRFVAMLDLLPFLSVAGYADRLNIHPKYFSSVCRKVTGRTPSQLIADQVIHRAQVMLREGTYSIKQIADMLGFANQSHFGTFFRRHTGMSPQQFLRH